MKLYKRTLMPTKVITVLFLVACSTCACAKGKFDGKWDDNGSQITRIGDLTIKKNTFSISGVADYKVSLVGKFGGGETYKVNSVNHQPDPLGCGPSSKITYISVLPKAELPGLKQEMIMVLFYSGNNSPKIETYEADKAVCEMHPYSKAR